MVSTVCACAKLPAVARARKRIVNRLGVLNRPGVFATPVPRLRGRKQERFVPALPEVPGVGGLRTPDFVTEHTEGP